MAKNTKNENNPEIKPEVVNPVSPVAGLDLVELIKLQEAAKAAQAKVEYMRASQLKPMMERKAALEKELNEIDETLRMLGIVKRGRPEGSKNKPKDAAAQAAPVNPEIAQTLSILKDVGTPENGVNIETMPTPAPVAAVA